LPAQDKFVSGNFGLATVGLGHDTCPYKIF